MIIIEHKQSGDIEHIVPYEKMDSYIRSVLRPGVHFTIKARTLTESDQTYMAPLKPVVGRRF